MSVKDFDNLITANFKTRGLLSSMTLNGKGGKHKTLGAEELLAPQVFVYLVEFPGLHVAGERSI